MGSQCSFVPCTVPRTSLVQALPGCVSCRASFRDNSDCGCSACFETKPQKVPESNPQGCMGEMCHMALGVPCMDCVMLSRGNASMCKACMAHVVSDPSLDGLCGSMAKQDCNPEQCGS